MYLTFLKLLNYDIGMNKNEDLHFVVGHSSNV